MCLFIAELNSLQSYATDIGNAYIKGFTSEQLYVKARKEFGNQKGNLSIVSRSLYGLRSSGVRWSETLGQCLTKLGFKRSKCEENIWICNAGDQYKLVGTYVDDLLICWKDPLKLLLDLQGEPFNFKLKGTKKIKNTVHLGTSFSQDDDGTLCMNPGQYIDRMQAMF